MKMQRDFLNNGKKFLTALKVKYFRQEDRYKEKDVLWT